MSAPKPHAFLLAALVAAAGLALAPLVARASDVKFVSAAECMPYAPDTTAAELQITPNGVYNFGTTIEKVLCPLPRDAQVEYPGGNIEVVVNYRVLGATPGRLTCTLYIGSAAVQSTAVLTNTGSGALVANGARSSAHMISGGAMDPDLGPNNVICSMAPKSQLGGIYLQEDGYTDSDYLQYLP